MGEAVKDPKALVAPASAAEGGEAESAGARNGENTSENGNTTTGTGQPSTTPQTTKKQQGSPYTMFILMGGVVLFFYFMIMRPQKKREQARRDMIGKLKTGDKVITASGIIGEIVEINDSDAVLKIDARKDVRMRVRRAAIAGLAGDSASEQAVKDGSS